MELLNRCVFRCKFRIWIVFVMHAKILLSDEWGDGTRHLFRFLEYLYFSYILGMFPSVRSVSLNHYISIHWEEVGEMWLAACCYLPLSPVIVSLLFFGFCVILTNIFFRFCLTAGLRITLNISKRLWDEIKLSLSLSPPTAAGNYFPTLGSWYFCCIFSSSLFHFVAVLLRINLPLQQLISLLYATGMLAREIVNIW